MYKVTSLETGITATHGIFLAVHTSTDSQPARAWLMLGHTSREMHVKPQGFTQRAKLTQSFMTYRIEEFGDAGEPRPAINSN